MNRVVSITLLLVAMAATPLPAANNAQVIGDTIPSDMYPGEQRGVTVTMKNTGTTTWTKAADYKLGSPDNSDPFAFHRVELGDSDSIAPNQQKVFSFTMTAPTSAGYYTTDWQMLKEYVEWFGGTDTKEVHVWAGGGDAAQYISDTIPSTMVAGQQYNVTLTMKNIGTATWSEANLYRLGTVGDSDPFYSGGRVLLGESETIAPQQSKAFSFTMTAPTTPGTYTSDWQMVHDLVCWFGDIDLKVINVTAAGTNDADYISDTIPSTMSPGQQYNVSVTMKNTGTTTWTKANDYKLGSPDNSDPFAFHRVELGDTDSIAPQQSKTFNFTMTAPTTPGQYTTDWQMLREYVEWFGDIHAEVVQVGSGSIRFNQTLDDATTVTVDNISSWSNEAVGALVLAADRSTQEDSPYNTPNYKGLFKTGDRICVADNYLVWFDLSVGDGVAFPNPPYSYQYGEGEMRGWWTLNPSTGTFRWPKTGPNGYNNWAHNELLAGSDSPNQGKFWWDAHSPGIEKTIDIPVGEVRFNFSSPHPMTGANSNFTITHDGYIDGNGYAHYRWTYNMTSRNFNIDVTDDNDANGISNYIFSDVEYICMPDRVVSHWWFTPVYANVSADLIDILPWLCYCLDEDGTNCDAGGSGEQWPNSWYGSYTYTQSNVDTYQNFSPYSYVDPGEILHLTLTTACSLFNPVIVTAPQYAVGDGTYFRVGEASDLSINYPRWEMTNLGVPNSGSGNSQSDPIQMDWTDMSVWNENGDGTIGFGLCRFEIGDPDHYKVLQAGKWYEASFQLRTNF